MDKINRCFSLKSNIFRKKKKGFTLIEMMVVLAITVMIACVIYAFYTSNNRTLTNAEAKSTLQLEGNQIQKDLLNYGTQANSIVVETSDPNGGTPDSSGQIDVRKITLGVATYGTGKDINNIETTNYIFEIPKPPEGTHDLRGKEVHDVKIYKEGSDTNNLQPRSTHVDSIKVKNLDSASGGNINNSSSVQITVNLYIKKGLTEVEYPVTTIVKLRNKNVTN